MNRIIEKINYWKWILESRKELKEFSKGHKVRLYNWGRPYVQDRWWFDFFEQRGLLENLNGQVALYSVFAPFWLNRFDKAKVRLFIERENLHRPGYDGFTDHLLGNKRAHLTLGFDNIQHDKYMRFPFWLMWGIFPATANYHDIKKLIKEWDSTDNHSFKNRKFCSFICSHDDVGRKEIFREISSIETVHCAGSLCHNNDDLKKIYNDNKTEYLRNYRFNLCPENTDFKDYVTEKLPEAIISGCIPIYQGSNGLPEPGIFNKDAIIFIKMGQENTEAVKLVSELNSDEKKYMDFACQKRFLPDAADIIWEYYEELEKRLRELINSL